MRGSMTLSERTMSLYSALSPAMLPSAHIACGGWWEEKGERVGGR